MNGLNYNNVFPPKETGLSLEDELLRQRGRGYARSKAWVIAPYGKRYDFTHAIPQILAEYSAKTAEELSPDLKVRVAGRVKTIRSKGKAGFAHLAQNGEQLQIYVRSDAVSANDFTLFQSLDIGDLIGAEGYLFRTRTGELSVHVERLGVPLEDAAFHARKVARPGRRGDTLPPALSRSHRES